MSHLTDSVQPSVETADPVTQLAVDLIYLLEINRIDTVTALQALKIVEKDYQKKLKSRKQEREQNS